MEGKPERISDSHPASILKGGSLLDANDVIRALREAYQFFIDNGKIEK
jgi:hypothetical protein